VTRLHGHEGPAFRIRANLFAYLRFLGRSRHAELQETAELSWLRTQAPHPFLNNVIRTQVAGDAIDRVIEATKRHFETTTGSGLFWWIEDGARPADLAEHLLARGFVFVDGGPGMAAELPLRVAPIAPRGLPIETVDGVALLQAWVATGITAFGLPREVTLPCYDLFADLGWELPLRHYVGRIDGKVVATAQLFLHEGAAGIYWVSTLKGYRRRGIAAALTRRAVDDAGQAGADLAVLQATELGLGVYRALGFRTYCDMGRYLWQPGG